MQSKKRSSSMFALRPACIMLTLALAPASVWALDSAALPAGGVIAAGQGSIVLNGQTLVVNQETARLIANWQQFSIGSEAHVQFVQPDASSIALNRVLGSEASQIFGRLSANGQVFLVNPNGVFFAPGATVNAGGVVASTLGIRDADFLAGRYQFEGEGGRVVNQGVLQADSVAMLGATVINDGVIQADGGAVGLAAGSKVTLDFEGDGLIRVDVDRATLGAEVANRGAISADGGTVIMRASARDALYSTVVNNSGVVRARSLVPGKGVVILDGGASGVVEHTGSIDVSGAMPTVKGGQASILGDKVAVMGDINADGAVGGGVILVGGGFQGQGAERNATAAFVGDTAKLAANATVQGDGGTVVVWSDEGTRFQGSISARGAGTGQGGLVETSGKEWLEVRGNVDASASQGKAGIWLLDPRNVTISGSATSRGQFSSGDPTVFNPTANTASVYSGDIENSLNNGTSVVITTGSTGTQSGDITVTSGTSISKTAGDDASLTLQAARHINMNGSITSTSGKLDVILNARAQDGAIGYVNLTGGTIISNGGNIIAGGGSDPLTGYAIGASSGTTNGVRLDGTTLSAGEGQISLRGQAGTSTATGLFLANGSSNLIETTAGNILLDGRADDGRGVLIQSSQHTFRSGSGEIAIVGESNVSNVDRAAVEIGSGTTTAVFETDSGIIRIEGSSHGEGKGVRFVSGALSLSTGASGGIVITGRADGEAISLANTRLQAGSQGIRINGQGQTAGLSGAGQVNMADSVLETAGGKVHLSSASHLVLNSSGQTDIRSHGGDIVLQSRSQDGDSGYIDLGRIALSSGGGDIVLGGGSDPVSGYAVGAASGVTNGIRLRTVSLQSGAGDITLNGEAGSATASGVNLAGSSNNTLETTSGTLRLSGRAERGHAVLIQAGEHRFRTESGDLIVRGQTAGANNGAVRIGSGQTTASFETESGRIVLSGTNTGESGTGVWLEGGALTLRTGDAGGITLEGTGDGDAVRVVGASLQAGSQGIRINGQGQTAGLSGAGQGSLAGADIRSHGGDVHISADSHIIMDRNRAVQIETQGGDITLQARQNNGSTGYVDLRQATLLSAGGDITIGGGKEPSQGYAIGAASGMTNGVRFGETILSAGSGRIMVNGQGGSDGASGISLANSSANLIETTSGAISLRGVGDGGGSGIIVQTGNHTIRSESGDIVLAGQAEDGVGVRIGTTGDATIRIETQQGDVAVTGVSGGAGDGVYIGAGDIRIAAAGQGRMDIQGRSVAGNGVMIGPSGSASATVLATEHGELRLTGQSEAGSGVAVYASAASSDTAGRGRAEIRSQSGNIILDGRSESGVGVRNSPASNGDTYIGTQQGDISVTGVSAQGIGLEIYPNLSTSAGREGSAVLEVGSGNISLNADTMSFAGPRTLINGRGVLTIAPVTPDLRIGFGTGTDGVLMLSNFNLQAIGEQWSQIVVGSPQSDWVEIGPNLPENIKVTPTVINRHQFVDPPSPQAPQARAAVQAAEILADSSLQPQALPLAQRMARDEAVLLLAKRVEATEMSEALDEDEDEEDQDGGE